MNGLEKMTQRIRSEGEAEIAAIRAEGEKRSEEICEGYRKEAAGIARKAAADRAEAAKQRKERLSSAAAMEGRQTLLRCKQLQIDEAFRRAHEALLALPDGAYAALLGKLAAAAGDGTEELILSPEDRARYGAAVVAEANARKAGARFTLSDETRDIRGGVILKSGRVERNCSFDTRLRRLRQEMATEVAEMLFE